ncbi:WD40 repeat domain-containing protein [Labrenzia sp. VG12]|uniref:WD40 repeat domain-containing protein n=1 Tax=Labrenzia sp. VG12 TaxID=2021862 RepID=UPI001AD8AD8D|nr:hypothetical protein [Labrenzia sp. VG12]
MQSIEATNREPRSPVHAELGRPERCAGYFITLLVSAALTTLAQAADFQTLKGHGGPIMGIDVSPETGKVATASFDNSVGLWSGRAPAWLEGHAAAVKVVRFVDGDKVVSAGDDNDLILWDPAAAASTRLVGHTAKVIGLAVSPDKSLIASASWDARVGLWPVSGGAPDFLEGHTAGVNAVVFSGDGQRLYSASVDGSIKLWDIAGRSEKRIVDRNGFGINVIALGGRGRRKAGLPMGPRTESHASSTSRPVNG